MTAHAGTPDAWPVFVDGHLLPATEPAIRAGDGGFLHGLAIFETLLLEDGHAYFLAEHLERLRAGAEVLSLPWPAPWDVRAAVAELARRIEERRFAVRVTYSRGVEERPTLVVGARRIDPLPADGVRLVLASARLLAGDPLGRVKSSDRLRYVLAREEARDRGAWEALLLNHEGDVAEGTVSNVFVLLGGELVTPALDRGGLGGIVRGRILTELERSPLRIRDAGRVRVREGRLYPDQLARATELFLTNSTQGVIPVRELRGAWEAPLVFPGAGGAVVRAVAGRFSEAAERDRSAAGNLQPGCG